MQVHNYYYFWLSELKVTCTSSVQMTSARMWSLVHSRQQWIEKTVQKDRETRLFFLLQWFLWILSDSSVYASCLIAKTNLICDASRFLI